MLPHTVKNFPFIYKYIGPLFFFSFIWLQKLLNLAGCPPPTADHSLVEELTHVPHGEIYNDLFVILYNLVRASVGVAETQPAPRTGRALAALQGRPWLCTGTGEAGEVKIRVTVTSHW